MAVTKLWIKFRVALAGTLAALALGGCYESEFALDAAPQVAIDPAVLGTWRCLPIDADADEQPATMVVARAGSRAYAVTWREGEKPPDRYEVFPSRLKGARMLNIRELPESGADRKWVFGRYASPRPKVLYLQIVNDKALSGVKKTRGSVRQAIARLQKSPALYTDFTVCAKAKDAVPDKPAPT